MVAGAAGWDENAPTVRRKFLAITAIVCLALCVALAGVQVYAREGGFALATPWSASGLGFNKQGLQINWGIGALGRPVSYSSWQGMGFRWESTTSAHWPDKKPHAVSVTASDVVLPYWFLYTLLLMAPGGWVWGRYRRRRQGRGFPVILAGEGEGEAGKGEGYGCSRGRVG